MLPASVAATAVSALLVAQGSHAQTFSAADISGVFEGDPFDVFDPPQPPPPNSTTVGRPSATKKDSLLRLCACGDSTEMNTDDIRAISDTWASAGNGVSSHGFSNLVWAWGNLSALASCPVACYVYTTAFAAVFTVLTCCKLHNVSHAPT